MDDITEDFLAHHGVLGMKWGHRKLRETHVRIRNARTKKDMVVKRGHLHIYSQDAAKAKRYNNRVKKQGVTALSNKELKDLVHRQNLEKQYKDLNPKKMSEGKKLAVEILGASGPLFIASYLATSKKYRVVAPKPPPGTDLVKYVTPSVRRKAAVALKKSGKDLYEKYGTKAAEIFAKSLFSRL